MNERIALRQTRERTCGLLERLYQARAEMAHEMVLTLESMHQAGELLRELHRLAGEPGNSLNPPAT